jgi:hypothetical protein
VEVHRQEGTYGTGPHNGPFEDRDTQRDQVRHHVHQWGRGDEAEIAGAWGRTAGREGGLFTLLMKIDLLGAEGESSSPTAGGDGLHPQHSFVEGTGSPNVAHGQDQMIEAFEVHGLSRRQRLAVWPLS